MPNVSANSNITYSEQRNVLESGQFLRGVSSYKTRARLQHEFTRAEETDATMWYNQTRNHSIVRTVVRGHLSKVHPLL